MDQPDAGIIIVAPTPEATSHVITGLAAAFGGRLAVVEDTAWVRDEHGTPLLQTILAIWPHPSHLRLIKG